MLILAKFQAIDLGVVMGYFALMIFIGHAVSRRKTDAQGYFLAQRSMPIWAVALSTVATSLSIATFTGGPESSFKGDLTYLSMNIGAFVAVFIVAFLFIPRLYRAGTITIYGYIDQRFGETARIAVSAMFLIGRLLASGARLFFAGIPVCLLLFNKASPTKWEMVEAILIVGAVGIAYTVAGGIRAVIWTDTLQIIIVMGAVVLSIFILLHKIPLSVGGVIDVLNQGVPPDGKGKLRFLDFSTNPARSFTLWTALVSGTCLNLAAYGVDHDMAQRMLTARSPLRGSLSLILAQFISFGVVSLFLIVGLLLYIFYKRPDVMGAAAPMDRVDDTKLLYPQFLLNHLSPGFVGLAMAGMFAAAQGSLDSAINAMASSAVADIYWPIRRKMGLPLNDSSSKSPRIAVLGMGLLLILFAVWSAFRYDPKTDTVLQFALGVMAFAYSGMLGVFLTALFTKRGNSTTVLAALIVGVVSTVLLQKSIYPVWTAWILGKPGALADFWWLPIGALLSFLVCASGSPQKPAMQVGFPVILAEKGIERQSKSV
jgi:SSS family solute:Na+ symporter